MEKKQRTGWLKHIDFILLDIICLQVSFVLAYWFNSGSISSPYRNRGAQFQALVLALSQLAVILFFNPYSDIVRRKAFEEAVEVIKCMAETVLVALVLLFGFHRTADVSRLQFGFTSVFFVVLAFLVHLLNKRIILKRMSSFRNKRSVVLITGADLVEEALERLRIDDPFCDFFVSNIVVTVPLEQSKQDNTATVMSNRIQACDDRLQYDQLEFPYLVANNPHETMYYQNIPLLHATDEGMAALSHDWIDEAFILQPEQMPFPHKIMESLMQMGVTVSYAAESLSNNDWSFSEVRKLGDYRALTSANRMVSGGQLALKRLMDIIGGIIGCLITGILFVFIAPAIYAKSPGPIFFKQERVGKNGKTFQMYKFRSMYMDAEARKETLMAQNKITDGMMFKMDDDPRIIGSEQKGKDGKPKGIGNFIRNTSIDEFPQFFNVLKGDMSLVGTRPPTIDEWNRYDLGHRIRMSIKPGITGMWQISGRSTITDFNEVVRLDRQYIEEWSILLDIKILLKTVAVVVTRKGAE